MKTWPIILIALLALKLSLPAQTPPTEQVPKYDKSTEAVFKGTVDDVKDRRCPVLPTELTCIRCYVRTARKLRRGRS